MLTDRQRHTTLGQLGLKNPDTQADTKVLNFLPTHILKNNFIADTHLAHLLLPLFIFNGMAKAKEPNLLHFFLVQCK